MKMWVLKRAKWAEEGAMIITITPFNREAFSKVVAEQLKIAFEPYLNSKLLVDFEMYKAIMEESLSEASKIVDIPKKNTDNKTKEEIFLDARAITDKILASKRSWTRYSATSNSIYRYAVISDVGYKLRSSDHSKDHTPANYNETLEQFEPGIPIPQYNNTPFGKVQYSSKWKTTLVDRYGNKNTWATSELNERLDHDNRKMHYSTKPR